MRILAVNKFYHLSRGADRYFLERNELLIRNGHEVIPFAMQHERNLDSPYARYFVREIHFFDPRRREPSWRVAGRVLYSLEARRKITRLLKAARPDIAHLHNIAHQLSPSILPPLRRFGIPVVQTLHDYKLICPTYRLLSHGQLCERCKGQRFYHAALQRCNRGSLAASMLNAIEMYLHHRVLGLYDLIDRFVAPSRFVQKKVVEFGIAPERVVHLPHFVDLDAWSPAGEPEDYLVYFGPLVDGKGIETLLKAMKLVGKAELYVIGEGSDEASLRALAEKEGLTRVRFLGFRSGQDLRSLVARGLFTVVPSEWYEVFGQTVVQSFAVGRPVIGARIGAIPELIEEGVNGTLFSPGNVLELAEKIREFLDHRPRLNDMGTAARRKAEEEFHPDRHYEGLMALYGGLIQRRG